MFKGASCFGRVGGLAGRSVSSRNPRVRCHVHWWDPMFQRASCFLTIWPHIRRQGTQVPGPHPAACLEDAAWIHEWSDEFNGDALDPTFACTCGFPADTDVRVIFLPQGTAGFSWLLSPRFHFGYFGTHSQLNGTEGGVVLCLTQSPGQRVETMASRRLRAVWSCFPLGCLEFTVHGPSNFLLFLEVAFVQHHSVSRRGPYKPASKGPAGTEALGPYSS